ncbi:MAG: hypothetical protein JWM09_790 [Francisellaceae bacterium]|nr:hypothetical protein [Francisellaceae bacterium]
MISKHFITLFSFFIAAVTVVAGCFSFWAWLKLNKSFLWLIPGSISLLIFAYCLTFIDSEYAGRAYAAYGAIYILTALIWMWCVEGNPPDRGDFLGLILCLLGSLTILKGRFL